MDTTKIQQAWSAKAAAKHLASTLGSLAHSHDQVIAYPQSESAKEYLARNEELVRQAHAEYLAAMEGLV